VGAALFLIAAVILARMPFGYLVRRLLVFWPMVVLLAVGIPLSHGLADGWLRMATVIVKATLAYLTVLALMATTPFDHVLWALRWFRVPRLLVAVIALMVRYLAVLTDELQRMQRARASRMFHRPGPADWLELPKLIGRLFIRSLERGERIHQAMLARGWTGEIHLL
jgi:cobalt/nickel transport system permease protein